MRYEVRTSDDLGEGRVIAMFAYYCDAYRFVRAYPPDVARCWVVEK